MKYIRLFEERLKDFEIIVMLSEPLIKELKEEIKREDYDLDYIRDLVYYGHFDIDVIWEKEEMPYSFLILASELDKWDIVKVLLEEGADPNRQDKWLGSTALHYASHWGRSQVVQVLLDHPKTDPNLKDKYNGDDALYFASFEGHTPVVKKLLNHPNIDPNGQNRYGTIALHLASRFGHTLTVQALLEHPNIDPNLQDRDGYTALHYASRRGRSQAVKELLKHPKTDKTIRDSDGQTAWDIASAEIRERFPELKP
jgi:ankyrin repeat protein